MSKDLPNQASFDKLAARFKRGMDQLAKTRQETMRRFHDRSKNANDNTHKS